MMWLLFLNFLMMNHLCDCASTESEAATGITSHKLSVQLDLKIWWLGQDQSPKQVFLTTWDVNHYVYRPFAVTLYGQYGPLQDWAEEAVRLVTRKLQDYYGVDGFQSREYGQIKMGESGTTWDPYSPEPARTAEVVQIFKDSDLFKKIFKSIWERAPPGVPIPIHATWTPRAYVPEHGDFGRMLVDFDLKSVYDDKVGVRKTPIHREEIEPQTPLQVVDYVVDRSGQVTQVKPEPERRLIDKSDPEHETIVVPITVWAITVIIMLVVLPIMFCR